MRSLLSGLILGGAVVLLSGCATTHFGPERAVRDAQNVPAQFLVGSPTGSSTTPPQAGDGCRNPMVDPRDGTRLTLVRSGEALGDYEVPAGQYGVGQRELLRVACDTGAPIGIVRR